MEEQRMGYHNRHRLTGEECRRVFLRVEGEHSLLIWTLPVLFVSCLAHNHVNRCPTGPILHFGVYGGR